MQSFPNIVITQVIYLSNKTHKKVMTTSPNMSLHLHMGTIQLRWIKFYMFVLHFPILPDIVGIIITCSKKSPLTRIFLEGLPSRDLTLIFLFSAEAAQFPQYLTPQISLQNPLTSSMSWFLHLFNGTLQLQFCDN